MAIIGAHVSAANGLHNCFARAKKIGAESIQIFGASPRQWHVKMPTEDVVKKFKQTQKKSGVGPVFLHASYLVNLGSPNNKIRFGSIGHLASHLEIAKMLGVQGLIFHPGSAKDGSRKKAIESVIRGMKQVLEKVPGTTQLILENTAGGGGKLGGKMEELGKIIKGVDNRRVKACIDTAHGFEAGVFKKFNLQELNAFVKKCDKAFGWKKIVALHINDSKSKSGSHHDIHANIGEGEIGLEGFKNLAKHSKFNKLPWILEVPGFDGNGPDKKNIEILRGLFAEAR